MADLQMRLAPTLVMPGLGPGIHGFGQREESRGWPGRPTKPTKRCERPAVIASDSEAIHAAAKKVWIASSRSLSSGAHSGDPLAPRNDGINYFRFRK